MLWIKTVDSDMSLYNEPSFGGEGGLNKAIHVTHPWFMFWNHFPPKNSENFLNSITQNTL